MFLGVAGTPYYNNLYFGPSGGFIQGPTAHALAATFWQNAMANLDNNMTATVEGEVAILEDTTGEIVDVQTQTPVNINVTGGSDPLPFTTQGLGQLLTGDFVAGRRVRGRIFIPGQVELNNANGVPSTTYLGLTNPQLDALFGVAGAPLAIWARPFPGKAADPDADPPKPAIPSRLGSTHIVNNANLWTSWASMRSRRD